jgi:hypothetical protein
VGDRRMYPRHSLPRLPTPQKSTRRLLAGKPELSSGGNRTGKRRCERARGHLNYKDQDAGGLDLAHSRSKGPESAVYGFLSRTTRRPPALTAAAPHRRARTAATRARPRELLEPGYCSRRLAQAQTPPPPHFQTRPAFLLVGSRDHALRPRPPPPPRRIWDPEIGCTRTRIRTQVTDWLNQRAAPPPRPE